MAKSMASEGLERHLHETDATSPGEEQILIGR
jgi:hypothetical protein